MKTRENSVKLAQIKQLVTEKKYQQAAALLRTVAPNQITSVQDMKPCAIVYYKNGYYSSARELYEQLFKKEKNRLYLQQLVYICIHMKDFNAAENYYQQFVSMSKSKRDNLILYYRIQKAKGASADELIAILEELKDEEYLEEWAYELAKLYQIAGRIDDCKNECENIKAWFGSGEVVERASVLLTYLKVDDKLPEYKDKDYTLPEEEKNPFDTTTLPKLDPDILRQEREFKRSKKKRDKKTRESEEFIDADLDEGLPDDVEPVKKKHIISDRLEEAGLLRKSQQEAEAQAIQAGQEKTDENSDKDSELSDKADNKAAEDTADIKEVPAEALKEDKETAEEVSADTEDTEVNDDVSEEAADNDAADNAEASVEEDSKKAENEAINADAETAEHENAEPDEAADEKAEVSDADAEPGADADETGEAKAEASGAGVSEMKETAQDMLARIMAEAKAEDQKEKEEAARREAEEKARIEAEEEAIRQAEEQARLEALERERKEKEEQERIIAEQKAAKEAHEKDLEESAEKAILEGSDSVEDTQKIEQARQDAFDVMMLNDENDDTIGDDLGEEDEPDLQYDPMMQEQFMRDSQSGTGITQDLSREISAIYNAEQTGGQLTEKAVQDVMSGQMPQAPGFMQDPNAAAMDMNGYAQDVNMGGQFYAGDQQGQFPGQDVNAGYAYQQPEGMSTEVSAFQFMDAPEGMNEVMPDTGMMPQAEFADITADMQESPAAEPQIPVQTPADAESAEAPADAESVEALADAESVEAPETPAVENADDQEFVSATEAPEAGEAVLSAEGKEDSEMDVMKEPEMPELKKAVPSENTNDKPQEKKGLFRLFSTNAKMKKDEAAKVSEAGGTDDALPDSDLPTTKALHKSIQDMLVLINGEPEPTHYVLIGEGTDRIQGITKKIIRIMHRKNFVSSTRIAMIDAEQLNSIYLPSVKEQLKGGCLLVTNASRLLFTTIGSIFNLMDEYKGDIVVVLADEGKTLDNLFKITPALSKRFQYVIDVSDYELEDYM